MSRLEIILTITATLSILINVGLVAYLRGVLVRLISISEELGDFQDIIDSYLSHLDDVYSLEMFYGDQTLQALLDHTAAVSEQVETFEYIYSLTDEVVEEEKNKEIEDETK
tara:strand:- start:259 stop:591 length:333 start_codon:yes stop_codon:yes gene_type:complete